MGVERAISATFLRDVDHGGDTQQPRDIANAIADFVARATSSVHIAIYDFRLSPDLGDPLVQTLTRLAADGKDVKIAYDHTKPNTKTAKPFTALGGDPAPKGTHEKMSAWFGGTKVQTKPILTVPDSLPEVDAEPIEGSHLMHNKYIIRDAHLSEAAVLTGSANFTDDAWTHQENNILQIASPELCSYYETDFQELWATGDIKSTGVNDTGTVEVGQAGVDIAFAPGEGPTIDAHIAALVSSARTRIRIASMIISSQQILGALGDALERDGLDLRGIYDHTQMSHILNTWRNKDNPAADLFTQLARHMAAKQSVPYSPNAVHNFMHNKVVVCDDAVATGSFNFSSNATRNAENSLIIHDKALADQYSAYVDALVAAYAPGASRRSEQ